MAAIASPATAHRRRIPTVIDRHLPATRRSLLIGHRAAPALGAVRPGALDHGQNRSVKKFYILVAPSHHHLRKLMNPCYKEPWHRNCSRNLHNDKNEKGYCMDTVLLILAVIGAALIVLAIAVFLGAARRNVSDAEWEFEQSRRRSGGDRTFRLRSGVERRQGADRRRGAGAMGFPLVDGSGVTVAADRRRGERRRLDERRRQESVAAQR